MGNGNTEASIVSAFVSGAVNGALSFSGIGKGAAALVSFGLTFVIAMASEATFNEALVSASTAAVTSFLSISASKELQKSIVNDVSAKVSNCITGYVASAFTEGSATSARMVYKSVTSAKPKATPPKVTMGKSGGGGNSFKLMTK